MKKSFVIIIAFALFFFCWYNNVLTDWLHTEIQSLHYFINYILSGIFPLIALWILHKKNMVYAVGLSHHFLQAMGVSIVSCIPMFMGSALSGHFNTELSWDMFFKTIIIAGIFEELFFRGFIFGELFRVAGWGFIPAVLISAVPFGLLHLYQGSDFVSSVAAFGVTALGGAFFSWIYVEWNYNLWCSIGMHTFMNLSWIIFTTQHNGATGTLGTNGFRVATIIIAILLTIWYKKQNHVAYEVTGRSLWRSRG